MKRLFFFLGIAICLLIINHLVRDIYTLWHKQDLVVKAESDLAKEKEENKKLKERLSEVKSQEFIESEARNKLFLVKPGESKIILPQDSSAKPQKTAVIEPNWEKWLKLFGLR